jgi:hypothetical protein
MPGSNGVEQRWNKGGERGGGKRKIIKRAQTNLGDLTFLKTKGGRSWFIVTIAKIGLLGELCSMSGCVHTHSCTFEILCTYSQTLESQEPRLSIQKKKRNLCQKSTWPIVKLASFDYCSGWSENCICFGLMPQSREALEYRKSSIEKKLAFQNPFRAIDEQV